MTFEANRGPNQKESAMGKYTMERTVPGAGGMTQVQLAALARASNKVRTELGPGLVR